MLDTLIATDWGERLRALLQTIVLLVASYLSPLSNAFAVLIFMAVADVFGGVAGNVWTGREEFKFRKAFAAVYKIIAYCLLVILVHFAVSSFNAVPLALTLVKFLTWTISYWYLSNILGNMCKAFPSSKGFLFLYILVSLKILPLLLQHMGMSEKDSNTLSGMIRKVREDDPADKSSKTDTNDEQHTDTERPAQQ